MSFKSDLVPDVKAAIERDALGVLTASDMSEIEIAERILELRGVQNAIADALKKAINRHRDQGRV